ncbi:MAG: PTS sugar transporter subunit IIA [Planctomycetaceae bacterium]|nr:PTS sugar transporter subunit IIA [Planctomycetaceae bacterium]
MKFSDIVAKDSIITDLSVETKEDAIRRLVGSLKSAGQITADSEESIVGAIMNREELGSTGIGKGIAVPHTKHPSVEELVATIAISRDGVDFASLDGEDVYIFFMLVSPPDRPGDHLRALETISKHLRNENFCNFLRQSQTAEQVMELLKEADHDEI